MDVQNSNELRMEPTLSWLMTIIRRTPRTKQTKWNFVEVFSLFPCYLKIPKKEFVCLFKKKKKKKKKTGLNTKKKKQQPKKNTFIQKNIL